MQSFPVNEKLVRGAGECQRENRSG